MMVRTTTGGEVAKDPALFTRLRDAEGIAEFARIVAAHGWTVPIVLLACIGAIRSMFGYLTDPYVVMHGYVFPGWPAAYAINLIYSVFQMAFVWFIFFGLISAFAGLLSDVRAMDPAVFKTGSYLLTLFAPVFVLGAVLAFTITIPDSAALPGAENGYGLENPTAYSFIHDTVQLHLVNALQALTWAIIGYLTLPVVEHRFELDRKQAAIAVLPVTLAAVVATQIG